MQRVEQESARMGVLVEDMLLLARLDQQRPIEHRPVDLLTLAADAVQDARIIAPGRDITLDVGSGAAFLVLGDEVRLRQVIGNLMNNALTHTPAGTPVAVRLLAGPRQPVPSVILEVADRGPGLRPDQAEHVFERFYRADQARTRTAGGTGLGLAIVAALVAAHDGTVALSNRARRGCHIPHHAAAGLRSLGTATRTRVTSRTMLISRTTSISRTTWAKLAGGAPARTSGDRPPEPRAADRRRFGHDGGLCL